MEKSPV